MSQSNELRIDPLVPSSCATNFENECAFAKCPDDTQSPASETMSTLAALADGNPRDFDAT